MSQQQVRCVEVKPLPSWLGIPIVLEECQMSESATVSCRTRALQLITKCRRLALESSGSGYHQKAREMYYDIIDELEAAVRLSNGRVPSRSRHWERKLVGIVERVEGILDE